MQIKITVQTASDRIRIASRPGGFVTWSFITCIRYGHASHLELIVKHYQSVVDGSIAGCRQKVFSYLIN